MLFLSPSLSLSLGERHLAALKTIISVLGDGVTARDQNICYLKIKDSELCFIEYWAARFSPLPEGANNVTKK